MPPQEKKTYAAQTSVSHTLLLRELLPQLPPFCAEYFRAIEPQTSALTRLAYAYDLRVFFGFLTGEIPIFGEKTPDTWAFADLERITAEHIERYLEYLSFYIHNDKEQTNANQGKMRKLAALRSFFAHFHKKQRLTNNVTLLVEMPKRLDKPILRLEPDEVARLLDLAESGDSLSAVQQRYHEFTRERDVAMLMLFLGTGIRVSECVGINLLDVDFDLGGFLITRKGGNQVVLYFSDEVAEALKRYIAVRAHIIPLPGHEDALFLSLQRRRITVRAVQLLVKKYAAIIAPLKPRLSPHKLRSTYGTALYHETGDIYLVADVLGHSDVNTTRRHYASMSDDRRRMAAHAVKLRDDQAGPRDGDENGE